MLQVPVIKCSTPAVNEFQQLDQDSLWLATIKSFKFLNCRLTAFWSPWKSYLQDFHVEMCLGPVLGSDW